MISIYHTLVTGSRSSTKPDIPRDPSVLISEINRRVSLHRARRVKIITAAFFEERIERRRVTGRRGEPKPEVHQRGAINTTVGLIGEEGALPLITTEEDRSTVRNGLSREIEVVLKFE